LIVGAVRYDDANTQWLKNLPTGRPVILYCAHGAEVSQTATAELHEADINAFYLTGGIAAWRTQNLPTRQKVDIPTNKWVTRERPKIDRIACPWLIRRFIDPSAEFLYVPTPEVLPTAGKTGAIPYDIEGVEFAHEGERCSFDTLLRIFGIQAGRLISWQSSCAAPTRRGTTRRRSAAACSRFRSGYRQHEMLAHGMVMYDALYTWCRSLQHETHNWPAKTPKAA
jgi:hypothetical protein